MADIYATSGAKFYIGQPISTQSADFVESDFDAMSWLEVGFLESVSAFGDEASVITFDAIGEGRTYKLKGTRNAGDLALVAAINPGDDGQLLLRAAEGGSDNYAFRVEFNDVPAGGSTPSYRYFVGLVTSAREQLDGANNVMKLNINIGINSNVVRTYAS